ncbi:hypothetical protein [Brevundimonas albigilva]|uniref:Excisionase n=1 Tax=Brevundimonas albigilva TaxID=1312364 RepID=A0ABY4SQT0_9CAUL|nr:hypothetical protein [Brevundimonas albigilva]URI15055.1 hypothetical protein M8231_14850 [Brevundimonas albigilva]
MAAKRMNGDNRRPDNSDPPPPEVLTFPCPPGIGLDTPLRLSKALAIAFPDGSLKPSTLMTEHRRGNLELEKVGGRWFVTLRDIQEMRKKCRVVVNRPDSGSESAQAARPYTSSSTEVERSARAAALIAAERLKKRSRAT